MLVCLAWSIRTHSVYHALDFPPVCTPTHPGSLTLAVNSRQSHRGHTKSNNIIDNREERNRTLDDIARLGTKRSKELNSAYPIVSRAIQGEELLSRVSLSEQAQVFYLGTAVMLRDGGKRLSTGWRAWVEFCEVMSRPFELVDVVHGVHRRPEYWLSEFACWLLVNRNVSGSSIEGYIKDMLQDHGMIYRWSPDTLRFAFVYKHFLKRLKRAVPVSKKLERFPLPLPVAIAIVKDSTHPLEFRCAVAVGMRALLRGGELFADVASDRGLTLHASDITESEGVLVLNVRADKSHGSRRCGIDVASDPFETQSLVREMMQRHANLRVSSQSPFLIDVDGNAPLKPKFQRWLARTASAHGAAHVLPHSLRIGGAVSLAAAGVSVLLLQAIGGWSSQAWMRYVHPHVAAAMRVSKALAKLQGDMAKSASFPDDQADLLGEVPPSVLHAPAGATNLPSSSRDRSSPPASSGVLADPPVAGPLLHSAQLVAATHKAKTSKTSRAQSITTGRAPLCSLLCLAHPSVGVIRPRPSQQPSPDDTNVRGNAQAEGATHSEELTASGVALEVERSEA